MATCDTCQGATERKRGSTAMQVHADAEVRSLDPGNRGWRCGSCGCVLTPDVRLVSTQHVKPGHPEVTGTGRRERLLGPVVSTRGLGGALALRRITILPPYRMSHQVCICRVQDRAHTPTRCSSRYERVQQPFPRVRYPHPRHGTSTVAAASRCLQCALCPAMGRASF